MFESITSQLVALRLLGREHSLTSVSGGEDGQPGTSSRGQTPASGSGDVNMEDGAGAGTGTGGETPPPSATPAGTGTVTPVPTPQSYRASPLPSTSRLLPDAQPFHPSALRTSHTPIPSAWSESNNTIEEGEDIEMGEVSEADNGGKEQGKEELEEGEESETPE